MAGKKGDGEQVSVKFTPLVVWISASGVYAKKMKGKHPQNSGERTIVETGQPNKDQKYYLTPSH